MKTKLLIKHWLIILILVTGTFLRLYNLNNVPTHLTPDEASLGYNAYSILKTGKDEYGQWLPIVFKSFGDYKPGFYIYLTAPFVAILGLNEWSVRLPSALLGIFSVWLIFKITNLVFNQHKIILSKWQFNISHITALVLALNPYHIQFSRGAWESQVALSFILTGTWLFLKSIYQSQYEVSLKNTNIKLPTFYYLLSAVFFGLTLWIYQGAKLATLLVLISIMIAFGKTVYSKVYLKINILALVILGIIALPIALGMLTGDAGRLKVFSIFSYQRSQEYINNNILNPANIEKENWQFWLYHGEAFSQLKSVLHRYFNYISSRYLFFEGDWSHPHLTPVNMGYFYWINIIPLFMGIITAINLYLHSQEKKNNSTPNTKFILFIVIWLILSPLPGALSRDEVSSVRVLNMIVPIIIFIGLGWYEIIKFIIKRNLYLKLILFFSFSVIQFFCLIYYLDSYYVITPQKTAKDSQGYGYKEVVNAVKKSRQDGKTVVISQSYDQPYIYFLFYEQYDPEKYQQNASLNENLYGDVGLVSNVDEHLQIRNYNWDSEKNQSGYIFIGDPVTTLHPEKSNNSDKFNHLADVKWPDGHSKFRIIEIK